MTIPDEPEVAAPRGPKRRSHTVLNISLGTALVVAVLVAVLASSKSSQVSANSTLIGKPAPVITGKQLGTGAQVSLSEFSGKWVLVNFSASWCIPCQQETPQLRSFSSEHSRASDGVVLGVAYDEGDVPSLVRFLRTNKANWPVVDDGGAVVSYGVAGIPESYLVGPNGTVVAKYLGGVTSAEVDGFISRAESRGTGSG
jgi:cytochrome c biogenesis protein CcmG, thiol:disulfide interchange protein DsbE